MISIFIHGVEASSSEAKLYGEMSLGDPCSLPSKLEAAEMLTTTPPSNMHPTIVVPVLVAFGRGTPLACNAALRLDKVSL